jgi:hypothetical protein
MIYTYYKQLIEEFAQRGVEILQFIAKTHENYVRSTEDISAINIRDIQSFEAGPWNKHILFPKKSYYTAFQDQFDPMVQNLYFRFARQVPEPIGCTDNACILPPDFRALTFSEIDILLEFQSFLEQSRMFINFDGFLLGEFFLLLFLVVFSFILVIFWFLVRKNQK